MNRRTIAVASIVMPATLLTVALWFGGAASGSRPPGPGPTLAGLPLAVMFALTEVVVLHVQLRNETQTLSLSEIPMVLGLAFGVPHELAISRVVGAALVLVLHRRQPLEKLLYNVAVQAAEVSVALSVYELVRHGATPTSLRGIAGLFVAIVAFNLLSGWCLQLVVGVSEGEHSLRAYLHEVAVYAPIACAVASFGLVAVYALQGQTVSAIPLLVCLGVLLAAYRLYSQLARRHLGLERLYQFTQAVSRSPEADQVLRSVLAQAREMLKASSASIALLADDGMRTAVVTLNADDVLRRDELPEESPRLSLHRRVVDDGQARLVTGAVRHTGRRRPAEVVDEDAICVPLPGGTGLLGTLTVATRLGDVGTFDASDLSVLLTIASHAGVALQNGHLIGQLRHEALHDALTGLPNRVMFERLAERLLEQLDGPVTGLAIGLLDLDGFKEVNDTLGHHAGDQLLVDVSRRLTALLGSEGHVARFGGDEFAVVLTDVDSDAAALARVREVIALLEAPVHVQDMDVQVRASIGVAVAPRHGTELVVLLKRADIAMYEAKNTQAEICLFDRQLDEFSPARLALISDLRRAVLDGELSVAVQPKVRLSDRRVVGVEALVRWHHPEHGPVSPAVFVPLAERYGSIAALTERVLDEALRASAEWFAAGHRVPVAVNLSPRALLDPGLVSRVADAIGRHRLEPSMLTLEITEGSVMADPDQALAVLHQLRAAGVRLSVDDFGTGYSSLSYLKRLPVQEVKIDRSFVTDLVNNAEDVPIVRSIVDLGLNLGLEVVAEGVEDEQTWLRLAELNCSVAQGYHLGRPMPVGELLPWLRKQPEPDPVAVPVQRLHDGTEAHQALGDRS